MSWSGLSDTGKNDLSSLLLFVLLADILLFSSSFCFDAKALINNAWLFFWYSLPIEPLRCWVREDCCGSSAPWREAPRRCSKAALFPVAALTLITLNLLFRGCSFLSLKGFQNYPEMSMTEGFWELLKSWVWKRKKKLVWMLMWTAFDFWDNTVLYFSTFLAVAWIRRSWDPWYLFCTI